MCIQREKAGFLLTRVQFALAFVRTKASSINRIAPILLGLSASWFATAGVVRAESISTGVASWQLIEINNLNTGTISQPNTPAPVITNPNSAWTGGNSLINAPDAKWIGPTASSGNGNGVWGWYTYQLTLTVPPLQSGQYSIRGSYSSDNMVDSFKVNGTELVTQVPPDYGVYGFQHTFTVGTLPQALPITITARVYNESTSIPPGLPSYPTGPTSPSSGNNATGFILSGTVTASVSTQSAVPLPSAAWGVSLLLGSVTVCSLLRRKTIAV